MARDRVVFLVDLDYFYAQCEERRDPSLVGKPVVVCIYSGRTKHSGAVSTANYVARELGVGSGMPIYLAKRRLEGKSAVFLAADIAFYKEVSNKVMGILREYADVFEQVGIDEAFLDVTRRVKGDYRVALKLAQHVKDEVKTKEAISSSIGIAPNKLVAKIAAEVNKPNGMTIVKPNQVELFLFPLPVSRLVGVGQKTRERLAAVGVETIGDLAKVDVQRLVALFGKKRGAYFHDASKGIDNTPVKERGEIESLSRISTLKKDSLDVDELATVTDRQCEEILEGLTQRGLDFRSIGIMVITSDLAIHSRSMTFEHPTRDLKLLKRGIRELLKKYVEEASLPARRVGVKVFNFSKEGIPQSQLTDFLG